MKKLMVILIIISMFCTSCTNTNQTEDTKKKTSSLIIDDIGSEIIEGYMNKDIGKIKSVFSENNLYRREKKIEREIEDSFEFIEGEIIEYRDIHGSCGGGRSINGEFILRLGDGTINEIKTDSNKVYEIYYQICVVDKNDSDNIGVSYILITDLEDGDEFEIGISNS